MARIKPNTKVKITGGPKDVRGKEGRVGEIKQWTGGEKRYVIDYEVNGRTSSVTLQRKDFKLAKVNESRKLVYGEKTMKFKDLDKGDKFQHVDRGYVLDGVSTKIGPRSAKDEAGQKWGANPLDDVLRVGDNINEGKPDPTVKKQGRAGEYAKHLKNSPKGGKKAANKKSRQIKEDRFQGWDPELLKMAKQYDRNEINMGLKAELEHNEDPKTDVVGDKNDVLKIVLAHMAEDPQYYTKLAGMENEVNEAPKKIVPDREFYQFVKLLKKNRMTIHKVTGMGLDKDTNTIHFGYEDFKDSPNWKMDLSTGKMLVDDAYAPAEYPQMRDPYKQGGFTPQTHISTNGVPTTSSLRKQKNVKHEPINPDDEDDRPRLKENHGSTVTAMLIREGFLKGAYATGQIKLKRDSAPVGHGFSIDINGTSMTDLNDPHDSAVVEMTNIDNGTEYGGNLSEAEVEYKAAYEYVLKRIKSAGMTRFFNKLRKAGGYQDVAHVPAVRLRALIRPTLKGPVRFVEYDFNRFEFKL